MLVSQRLWWAASACALFAVCAAACSAGNAVPPLTATAASTATATSPPTHTPTPTLLRPADVAVLTPQIESVDGVSCRDPYAGGAPYVPTPSAPLRLRPSGTPTPIARFTPLPFVRDAALEAVMRQALGNDSEHFGVYVKDLAGGRGGTVNSRRPFYSASLYKTWVMLEAEHQVDDGLLALDQTFIVSDYYAALGLNDGELQACDVVSLEDALAVMMSVSDNVAANLLLERLGPGNINASLRRLGLNVTGFYQDDSLPTTAAEMGLLLEAIGRRQAVSADASDAMLALLETEQVNDRLGGLLPEGTRIAHKTGSWPSATHDAGIIYAPGSTYVVVVLTDYDFTLGLEGKIAQLSRAVYDYLERGR